MPPLEERDAFASRITSKPAIVRQFAAQLDVLFIRLPFQIPTAVCWAWARRSWCTAWAIPHNVIAASSDYRGLMKRLALTFAAHSNATIRRMVAEPMTRAVTNGSEMWDILRCRDGRVVVSSCIYQRRNAAAPEPEAGTIRRDCCSSATCGRKREFTICWMRSSSCASSGP